MDKIDWVTKLSSRKFWAAVTGFLTALLTIFEVDNLTIEQIIGLVSALSVLIAYIIGEGMVDAARASAGNESTITKVDKV
jgi:hypothetical protein